jgi:hypothetical protein
LCLPSCDVRIEHHYAGFNYGKKKNQPGEENSRKITGDAV